MSEAIDIIGVLRCALRGNKGHLAFAEPSRGILAKQTIKPKTINTLYVKAYFDPPSNNRLKLTAHLAKIVSARSLVPLYINTMTYYRRHVTILLNDEGGGYAKEKPI